MCASVFSSGCRKTKTTEVVSSGKISVNVSYAVSGQPLVLNSVLFTNAAGNHYSVEKLQYYLSGFSLFKNKELKYASKEVFYVDAGVAGTSHIQLTQLSGLPTGSYDSVSFYIGIEPSLNISNGLPSTLDNIAMGWPDAMGGGYHFLKMEGYWENAGALSGYAIHLGTNGYQVKAGVRCNLVIKKIADATLAMHMDINEWFSNPHIYDLATDGPYSMGNATLMQKLTDNGADVFNSN